MTLPAENVALLISVGSAFVWILRTMARHAADHVRMREDLARLVTAVRSLPCARHGICDDRAYGPALTPLDLPVVQPK